MYETTKRGDYDAICYTIKELMAITGLGRNTADRIGIECGAKIKIGRRCLYKAQKMKDYFDKCEEIGANAEVKYEKEMASHFSKDGTIALKKFLEVFRENFKPENNFLLRMKLDDWVWLKSHISDGAYLNISNDLRKYEFMFAKIKGIRKDAEPGVVVNFIKSIYTLYQNRELCAYGEKLESFDIKRFNKNIVDPIKLIFDKTVYQTSWKEMVGNEIFRQRDKSNNNDIGYFHQRIFQYIDKCHVPENGKEGGWDVIYQNPDGIVLLDGDVVHTVYVEMKNKEHLTMHDLQLKIPFFKRKRKLREEIKFDPDMQYAVIRSSICTGEKVAGFKNKKDGHFTEVMLIRSPEDEKRFKKTYGLDMVKVEY